MSATGTWVAGVDGCPAGWVVVLLHLDRGPAEPPRLRAVPAFADVLALPEAPVRIAIDMPIGLPERAGPGGRPCDVEARARLGRRRSSVFPVPARAAVMAADYGRARAVAVTKSDPPRSISKQCFNLFGKIREIDRLMTPALQDQVFECHPELAFWAMNSGQPLDEPKKLRSRPHAPGLALRRRLLAAAGMPFTLLAPDVARPKGVAADDLLDAAACAWTAARVHAGTAVCLPATPSVDGRGLRMEIRA